MIESILLAAAMYVVRPSDTLSGIAVSHGLTLTSVEAGNPQIHDFNLIYVGESVNLGPGHTAAEQQPEQSAPVQPVNSGEQNSAAPLPASAPAGTSGTSSFQSCVITRESGGNPQVMNSSGHYGLYQFSAETWAESGGNPASFGHASVAEQNAAFHTAFQKWGTSPWAPSDHC